MLGLGKDSGSSPPKDKAAPARPSRPERRKNKDLRLPLPEVSEGASATIEDVLEARAAGHAVEARAILASIDKGQGLRTVLRAAAALEAGDEEELAKLLPGGPQGGAGVAAFGLSR